MGSVQARGKGRDGNGYWMTLYGLEREIEREKKRVCWNSVF